MNFPKNSAIVVLTGGFGNQMFQFAYGLYLEQELGFSVYFECDLGKPRKIGTSVALLNLNLADRSRIVPQGNRYFTKALQKCYGWNLTAEMKNNSRVGLNSRIIKALTTTLLRCRFGRKRLICVSKDLGFDDSLSFQNNSLQIGYFQTYIYASHKSVLSKLECISPNELSSNYNVVLAKIKKQKPFLLHVRLTDYTSESSFGIPSVTYYRNALQLLLESNSSKSVWVISDDVYSAKTHLKEILHEYEFHFFDETGLSDLEVWSLMREFSGYILSNSSFAWWAAFLRKDLKAKVCAPEPWFHGMDSPNQLLPNEWARVRSL